MSVYASDFGELAVMPNNFSRSRSALLIDPDYMQLAVYRDYQQVPISAIGDAETRMILVEFGLQITESANAVIADLTTS